MGVGDGVAPTIITSTDGSVAVRGGGAVDLSAAGGATGTPFRLIPVPATTTNSLIFVNLMTAPGGVSVVGPGNVLLDFDASMQVTIPLGPGAVNTFQIVSVQFLWDGVALIDTAFAGVTPAQADLFNTIVYDLRCRSLIVSPAVGLHTLAVQWNVADATCFAEVFANNGNLSIETKF